MPTTTWAMFYELWLDDTMNYSSAWFDGGNRNSRCRRAQHAKMRRALRESA